MPIRGMICLISRQCGTDRRLRDLQIDHPKSSDDKHDDAEYFLVHAYTVAVIVPRIRYCKHLFINGFYFREINYFVRCVRTFKKRTHLWTFGDVIKKFARPAHPLVVRVKRRLIF